MSNAGRSLELFFIDGKPDGMLTAEVFNWTGHVLRIPRTLIKKGLDRAETNQTGVYVLIGQTEDGPLAYVGEAEDMRTRLRQHVSGKEWWDTAILITTTGDMLHKAHVKYLESRLVEIARSIGNTPLENASTPPRSSLNEAAMANMESFLDTLKIVLPAIRVDMFLEKASPARQEELSANSTPQFFVLSSVKTGVEAKAELLDGQFVVQVGSKARTNWIVSPSQTTAHKNLHAELLANGTLLANGNFAEFSKSYAFSSPNVAATIIFGRAANGRNHWKHAATGKTFAEWETAQISEETPT